MIQSPIYNKMKLLNILTTTILFFTLVSSYKEFSLVRTSIPKHLQTHCYNQNFDNVAQTYQEICFQKDISYNLQLYIDQILYYVSLDFTTPYTWFKSPECLNSPSNDCSIIHDKEKHKVLKEMHGSSGKFRFFDGGLIDDGQNSVAMYGSTNLVLGNLETISKGQFQVRNSQNLKNLLKIFGISLFIIPSQQTIRLSNYNFIKANKLSYDLNALTDGALSLLINNNSTTNNIFYELLKFQAEHQKIVSLYINAKSKKGVFAFGEISMKYTITPKKDIKWIPLKYNQKGYQCTTYSLLISKTQQPEAHFIQDEPIETYFSISTSNIHLPSIMIQHVKKILSSKTHANCKINQLSLLHCTWKTIQHKRQVLFLNFYFKIDEKVTLSIPMITLINISHDLFMEFTIKESQSNFIILGEPFFEEYIVYLDFHRNENMIGFAPSYAHNPDFMGKIVIYFFRAFLFTFIALIIIYIFFKPLYRLWGKLEEMIRKWRTKKSKVVSNFKRYQKVAQEQDIMS